MSENQNEKLNLYQRLAKIRSISDAVVKTKSGYGYKYIDINDVLAKVTAGMKKYGVSLIPNMVPDTMCVERLEIVNDKVDKTGQVITTRKTELLFETQMVFRWVLDEDPSQYIDVVWFASSSMPDVSQAIGSGLTYSTRYFLTSYFQIAQNGNDVDEYRSKQREASDSEEKLVIEEIIKKFDADLKDYLANNPDKKEEIKDFVGRYATKSDYKKIRSAKTAADLLNDFTNKYIVGNNQQENAEEKEPAKKKVESKEK